MDYIPVIAVMSEVQEDDPKSDEKALELSSYLDKTAKETESDDEVTFFEDEEKAQVDLAETTDKADEVVLSFAAEPMIAPVEDPMEGEQATKSIQSKPVVAAIEGDITTMEVNPVVAAIVEPLEGDMLSPKLEEVLEDDPKSSEIPLETESDDEMPFVELEEKPKAELADKADLVFEVEEPSEPEMKPVNSFEEEAAHGTLSTALKRSYDHEEISSLPEKKVRNDDAELQDEAGDDTPEEPEEPIKALEEKELKLDLIPEPEMKSDADPFGLEFSEEIVETMSRDDLERLFWKKVAEAEQVRAQLDKSQKTVALIQDKLAKVCKKLFEVKRAQNVQKENFGQQVGVPAKAWKSWNDFCNKWDIPSSPNFTHHRQEPNLASASYLIDLTDDVTDEDEEEVAAAEATARSEKIAQVSQAVNRANAFLRQTANEAAKENFQPGAAPTSSSGGRKGVIFKRASRMPLAPLRRRP